MSHGDPARDPVLWARLAARLDEALELGPERRADWLARLPACDADLRPRIEAWLELEGQARGFLEAPLAPGASWERAGWLGPLPGEAPGGFRILRVLGHGATSLVYEAEQTEPRRRVALKVFQTGLAGPDARRRFTEEAEILATLRHPGIAAVIAAGTEGEGEGARPWIAMELVPGARTVTRFAREEGLALAARLELCARIAEAVAYGHRHGVIHRDLKPANLLVDSDGNPKVIDFGIAKVLDGSRGLASATHTGALLGTLAWMSPEQLVAGRGSVDTRSDVYALGRVLHELVRGSPAPASEAETLEDTLRALRTPPARLPGLAPDLAAILQVALAEDPERRYREAGELAADLRRFLARQPVVARPPSLLHHLRLALARHRAAAIGWLVALLVLAGTLGWGALRAARVEARERVRAREVTRFLESILELAVPSQSPRADLTMREVLEDASKRIEDELAGAPDARAEVHALVGSAWRELGQLARAEEHLRAAVAILRAEHPGSEPLAGSLSMLSDVLLAAGRASEADGVLAEAGELYAAHPELPEFYAGIVTNKRAEARRQQGDLVAAEELAGRALAIYRRAFGAHHTAVGSALHNLAATQRDAGALEAAEASAREALAVQGEASGPGGLLSARTRALLGEILDLRGAAAEARIELARAAADLARLLPEDHPERARVDALRARISAPTR